MSFATEYLKVANELKTLWHDVSVPLWTEAFLKWERHNNWGSKELIEAEMQEQLNYFEIMKNTDCILVTNYEKNWMKWYIWWWVFMEMSVAFYMRKPIFLLNQMPSEKDLRYVQEISIMKPIIIEWNLKKINF